MSLLLLFFLKGVNFFPSFFFLVVFFSIFNFFLSLVLSFAFLSDSFSSSYLSFWIFSSCCFSWRYAFFLSLLLLVVASSSFLFLSLFFSCRYTFSVSRFLFLSPFFLFHSLCVISATVRFCDCFFPYFFFSGLFFLLLSLILVSVAFCCCFFFCL